MNRTFESSTTWRTASQNAEGDGSDGLAGYHNDGIMDVQQLVAYMKEQVQKYLKNSSTSDFDSNKDANGDSDPRICVTVFVDEYYYEKDPLHDTESGTLWKKFVNADDRKLHILCNSNLSKDLESRSTGSIITIQQHSIQTIFNNDESNSELFTAWGVETEDEFEHSLHKDSSGDYTLSSYWSDTSNSENRGNSDEFNGLLNTAKEWGLCDASSTSFKTGSSWGTYMNLEVDNDTPQLNDGTNGTKDYNYLRYSCMTRNRDNNGNGMIDRNELRWYMASIQQLIGLFVGKNVLQRSTQLYNRTAAEKAETDDKIWMQHVISSTMFASNSNDPTIVWAEEGVSTSNNLPGWNFVQDYESVRCVRNLGYLGNTSDETYDLGERPDDYVEVTDGSTNSGKIYDASLLNNSAIRYYTTKELPSHCETDIENQLYKSFESDGKTYDASSSMAFGTFNDNIDDAIAEGSNFCAEGWRVPNQVELAVMRYYGGEKVDCFSRTYYSFGSYKGSSKKRSSDSHDCGPGFSLNSNYFMTAENEYHQHFRCVRDIRVD